jgi:hypothetical protein
VRGKSKLGQPGASKSSSSQRCHPNHLQSMIVHLFVSGFSGDSSVAV